MNLLQLVTDPYTRVARIYPALLVLLPVVATVLVWFPNLQTPAAGAATLLGSFGCIALLAQLGRDRGKACEPGLFEAIGGKPSVAMLRHSDPRLTGLQKSHYHQRLGRALGSNPPTRTQERTNPERADEWYDLATNWLIARTRDASKFGLLLHENVNYGFRRNLYGLKGPALLLSGTMLLASAGYAGWRFYRLDEMPAVAVIGLVGFLSLYPLLFARIVTPEWIRIPSEGYARRLLESCEVLTSAPAD